MPRSTYRRRRFRLHLLMTQLMLLLLSSSFGNSSEIINDEIDVDVSSLSEINDNETDFNKSLEVVGNEINDNEIIGSISSETADDEINDSGSPEIVDDDVDDGRSSEIIGDEINDDSSSEITGNDIEVEDYFSKQAIEQYYFGHEIDFLARQAMTLGNHPNANSSSKNSPSSNSHTEEKLHRLRFIEKSLQMELDYIRRFRETKAKAKDSLDNDGLDAELEYTESTRQVDVDKQRRHERRNDMKETERDAISFKVFMNTISEATWPTWAPPPFSVAWAPTHSSDDLPETCERDHPYGYDWMAVNGFALIYDRLACTSHAHSQNKPLYTPEQWDALWNAFQQSTLFPFPIPQPDECPDEPFSSDHTTDGKGRGNFASRDIPEGSLVHGGHPNTIFFLDNDSFFRFVSSLPKMMVCDVLEWAWQQDLTNSGNVVLCLNLDEAVFFNDGTYDDSTNIDMKTKTSLDFYAMRDIAEGEELLYDYSHYEFDTLEMDL